MNLRKHFFSKLLLCLLFSVTGTFANKCDTYNHPTYGVGSCVHIDRCPYSLYQSNLCENEPEPVKCCFSTPTPGCGNDYTHPVYGKGECMKATSCPSGSYSLPGYCDGYPSDYRCCFNNATVGLLKKCAISDVHGKGVCVPLGSCPQNNIALVSECDGSLGEVCCYSLQNDVKYYEFRGVWVSTVANIDWPSKKTLTTDQQKTELLNIIEAVYKTGLNAIIFQIRPSGDALYNSDIEPWSVYLTGTQGKAPNPLWDPLEFMVTEAHKRNIEVHAWFNPYRARNKGDSTPFASNHMAIKYSQYAYSYGGYVWMDPGAEVVRTYTVNVIADVVSRYNIDGVHFDDYFYPYNDGTDFPDKALYDAYVASGGKMTKNDWRRDNVNKMVQDVYAKIKSLKPRVHFGISPFGIWRPGNPPGIVGLDSFDSIFADSKTWLQNGWVDYLAPQLYWAIDPPAQSYSALLKWWCEQNIKNKLIYAGNAVYKLGTTSSNWEANEIKRQVEISRAYRNISSYGNIHFTMNYLMSNYKGITDVLRSQYSTPALTPMMKK